MPAPPDQFQRRTYVRLPFTDDYLDQKDERRLKELLRRAFAKPILTVRIASTAPEGNAPPPRPGAAGSTAGPALDRS